MRQWSGTIVKVTIDWGLNEFVMFQHKSGLHKWKCIVNIQKFSIKFVSVRRRPCLSMINEDIIVVYPLTLKAWSWILARLFVTSPTECTTLTWNSDYFGSIGLESAYLTRNRQHSVGDVTKSHARIQPQAPRMSG